MTDHSRVPPEHGRVERAIVRQLLRADHGKLWPRTELEAEIDAPASELAEGLQRLELNAVVLAINGCVIASPSVWRIDALGLIQA